MRNKKKILNETDNSRVYKMAKNEIVSGCPLCSPHKGCNRNWDKEDNWKSYRKTQWK